MDEFIKIPSFKENTESLLTVNRLPVELPGVIAATELESEYTFTPADISLDWPVSVYAYDGKEQSTDCDAGGVGASDTAIFTYIDTVRSHQEGRTSPWLLEALLDNEGLTYGDSTAGITKGPALPMGDNSPYLFTPAFIPAVDVPGITSPKPEEPQEPLDPNNISLSVKFMEHDTGTNAKSPRSVCDSPDPKIVDVVVECSYNSESGMGLPGVAVINLTISSGDEKVVTLYAGTAAVGTPGKALTASFSMGSASQKREKFTFNYAVDTQAIGANGSSITATAELVITKLNDSTGWRGQESAELKLECRQDGASDLFDYTIELLDINRSPTSWNREDCDTDCAGEACREFALKVNVTKKQPNTALDTNSWRGEVLLSASPTDGTIFIGSAGSTDSDILNAGATSLSPYSLNLPLSASVNSATTYIEFQYVTNFQCTESSGSGGSATINCDLKIYNTNRVEADDLLSVGDIHDTSHKVQIECTCEDCSKTAKDNLTATLDLYEHSSDTALKLARKVCEYDSSVKDPVVFDTVVSVAYNQPDGGCKLNLIESCVFIKIIPSNSTVGVRSFPNGTYEDGVSRRVALSERGGTITARMAFEYTVYEEALSKSWNEDIVVSLEFLAVSDTGKSTVHKITEKKIRLICSADESIEDCVEAMSASILLYEANGDSITTTEAKKTRAHCNEDTSKDKQPHFFISPVVDFPDSLDDNTTNSCNNIVSGTGNLIISANGTSISGYGGIYKDSIIKVPVNGRLGDIPDYHLEYTVPAAGKKGTINIRLELSGTYVNSAGEQISWSRAAEETVTVKCGEDSEDPDPEDSCGVLNKLKAGDGIDISDCNSSGERTISVTGAGLSCEALGDMLEGNGGITVTKSCDSDPSKVIIGYDGPSIACDMLAELLTGSGATTVTASCSTSPGKITIATKLSAGVGITTTSSGKISIDHNDLYDATGKIAAKLDGNKILLPGTSVDCGTLYNSLKGADGITISECSDNVITIGFDSEKNCSDIRDVITKGDMIAISDCTSGKFSIGVDLDALEDKVEEIIKAWINANSTECT